MALDTNEMLQDPAILMTSKNPSLTGPKSPSAAKKSRRGSFRSKNKNKPSSPETPKETPSITTSNTKSVAKSSNKVTNTTGAPLATNEMLQDPAILMTSKNPSLSGSNSPAPAKKSRRGSFRSKNNKNETNSPKTPKQTPDNNKTVAKANNDKVNNATRTKAPLATNNINALVAVAPPLIPIAPIATKQQHAPMMPFRRFPLGGQNGNQPRHFSDAYQPRHFFSELNPFAQSFVPRYFTKPGMSNEYVSREIYDYYQRNRQTNEQFKGKQTLRQALENTLKQSFPDHVINLYMVGSATNGIGDNAASVDVCIMARKRSGPIKMASENPPAVDQKTVEPHDSEVEKESPVSNEAENVEQSADVAASSPEVESPDETSEIPSLNPGEPLDSEIEKESPASNEAENVEQSADVASSSPDVESPVETSENPPAVDQKTVEPHDSEVEKESPVSNEAENLEQSDDVAPTSLEEKSLVETCEIPNLTLGMIETVLQTKNFAKNIASIPARVPIIKFKDDISKLDITLNLNQDVSIRNTQLIRDYAKMDWRFPYLAMVLKQWARENRICSAIDKTISSYSWTLMVIHYLQVCEPPVLPSLQKMIPRRYDQRSSVEQAINNWRRYPSKWRSNNTSNLRQLLKGLFRYYGYVFSYDQHVISIREGKVLDRASFVKAGAENQWSSFLCIEEPFTRTNTSRSVHDKEKFDRIIELFRTSSNALRGVRISLFNVIVDDLSFPITY